MADPTTLKSQTLETPFGLYQLERIPHDKSNTLRAWDAADEYLLAYIHEHYPNTEAPLILNDNFGALGVSLNTHHPVLVNDSFVSQQAIDANITRNQLPEPANHLDSLSPLPEAPLVIIKQPKNTRYFEYQLQLLNHYLPAGTPIIMGAMVKYLSNTFFKLAEQYLVDMHTSLAKKKSRLVIGRTQGNGNKPPLETVRDLPEFGLKLVDTPNVFAAGKIDIGSRFFLKHFPDLSECTNIIDLGCGNGILGISALKHFPDTQVTFVDESYHAIHAARGAVKVWMH